MQTETEFKTLPLSAIVPSLTNPRKTFNPEKLQELANSIAASGVHQPIVVRPLPGARVPDTDKGVQYEIVFGARRYRACQLAKVATLPVLVRDLSDQAVIEAQIIENLQREDLSPLEEAEGYRQLCDATGITKDQVGDKIGKSRGYVYARLKLLDLGQDGRAALRDGKIEASTALLVARIPDGKLQAKALKDILDGDGWSAPMTHRDAQEHIQERYMLKLADARFTITVADLVPGVGSCKDCAKRTGADRDLFSDVKSADVCTDPPCFHKKEAAHSAQVVAEAEAKGQTVIPAKEAAELQTGYGTNARFKGYKRLDDKEDSPTDEPLREIVAKLMDEKGIKPTMLEHPTKKGQLLACLPNDVANSLLKIVQERAKANKKEAPQAIKDLLAEKQTQEKDRLDAKFEREVHTQIIAQTWAKIQQQQNKNQPTGHFSIEVHRLLASQAAWSLDSDGSAAASKLLSTGSVGAKHGLSEAAKKHPRPDLLHLLLLLHGRGGEGFDLVTQAVWGSELKELTTRIKAEVKASVYPPAKKAPTANAPAAQANRGAGGKPGTKGAKTKATAARPKTSAEEAKRGIAAAMQGLEGAASAPKGAVAPPAAPGGKQVAAWPFPTAPRPVIAAKTTTPTTEAPADPLLAKAIKIITKAKKASVRLLKDGLGIGTTKAMELMAQLEAAGKVSAAEDGVARKVLVGV